MIERSTASKSVEKAIPPGTEHPESSMGVRCVPKAQNISPTVSDVLRGNCEQASPLVTCSVFDDRFPDGIHQVIPLLGDEKTAVAQRIAQRDGLAVLKLIEDESRSVSLPIETLQRQVVESFDIYFEEFNPLDASLM
jgi:hypothetical protein